MARITIVLDVDVDPTLEDPHDVAEQVLYDYEGRYGDLKLTFVSAEWDA